MQVSVISFTLQSFLKKNCLKNCSEAVADDENPIFSFIRIVLVKVHHGKRQLLAIVRKPLSHRNVSIELSMVFKTQMHFCTSTEKILLLQEI